MNKITKLEFTNKDKIIQRLLEAQNGVEELAVVFIGGKTKIQAYFDVSSRTAAIGLLEYLKHDILHSGRAELE